MSWHYLPELVADFSAVKSLDGGPSAPSKKTDTARKSCSSDNETDSCQSSRSGTILEPLTADHSEEVLTWLAGVSPAKTFHMLGMEKDLQEIEADYGQNI